MENSFVSRIVLIEGESLYKKVVISTSGSLFNVNLITGNGRIYGETTNFVEPFAFTTHVFYMPEEELVGDLTLVGDGTDGASHTYPVDVSLTERFTVPELIEKYDSRTEIVSESSVALADGISYKILTCKNGNGMPVIVYAFFLRRGCFTLEVGTANDGYLKDTAIATVEEQARARMEKGQLVIGATNADFFDMFNDNAPSGLCVKDSRVIANSSTTRSFLGFTKNGECVIGNFVDNPHLAGQLRSAVGGREIFLKNGEIAEFSPGEPFSYVCHPRTAVGITDSGDVIITVVDGRIPAYSNGASIIDLARLMQKLGAKDAINLDGGGSSIFLVRSGDGFAVLNTPADLERPNDKLIRPIYNSLQIVVDKK